MATADKKSHRGFTLVETVVGIVVMTIALTLLSGVFFSRPQSSVEPLLHIRAAVFGQALMDEILGKAFDETTPVGGVPACTTCTASASFGSEGESRSAYDDVDDYHDYCNPASPVALVDVLGNTPADYTGYGMSVCVIYDGNYDGLSDTNINAKLITVDIFPRSAANFGSPIRLTAYRGNF